MEASLAKATGSGTFAGLDDLFVKSMPPYRIGPQDVLLVTVWDHPEITLPLGQYRTDAASGMVVDEEGFLYFPYVGKFQVRGLTATQTRETLTNQLAKVLQNPQVDVKVLSFRSQKIFVGGEVKTPAVYTVTDVPFTLTEAINRAGGFLATSDDSRIVLTRGEHSYTLDFQAIMRSGNRFGEILLKEGDFIHVPAAQEEPVYVLGELTKPGTLPLIHGHLSLAQALAYSGGILGATADARSIYVLRQGSTAKGVDVFHVDARNPASLVMADQFALHARDIVYVDAGPLVRWNRVMTLLIPTFSALTQSAYELKYITSKP
jgi:polysaccharide export outer membrane protein